jgi:hypothetical protein
MLEGEINPVPQNRRGQDLLRRGQKLQLQLLQAQTSNSSLVAFNNRNSPYFGTTLQSRCSPLGSNFYCRRRPRLYPRSKSLPVSCRRTHRDKGFRGWTAPKPPPRTLNTARN